MGTSTLAKVISLQFPVYPSGQSNNWTRSIVTGPSPGLAGTGGGEVADKVGQEIPQPHRRRFWIQSGQYPLLLWKLLTAFRGDGGRRVVWEGPAGSCRQASLRIMIEASDEAMLQKG